jgi:hypothetical protein
MDQIEEAALDIMLPVLEASIVYASHYCNACGRSTVSAEDMEYGLKYAAMTTVGKHLGTHFPEIYEEDTDEETDEEIDEDEEEQFTRYEGTEELFVKMNEAYDAWDSWEPESPAEFAIKNAINKQKSGNGRVHPE